MLRRAVVALGLSAIGACSRSLPPLRMIDIAEAPQRYVGRTITVDIVESLRAGAGDFINVDIPELGDDRIVLTGLDPVPTAPIRARGELFRRDARLFSPAPDCTARCYVFRVAATEPSPRRIPEKVGSLQEILANPERWDRQVVIYEGTWATGFERSTLDERIWLDVPHAEMVGVQTSGRRLARGESKTQRVRVTGVLYAHPQGRYGHLGGYPLALDATRLEGTDPAQ